MMFALRQSTRNNARYLLYRRSCRIIWDPENTELQAPPNLPGNDREASHKEKPAVRICASEGESWCNSLAAYWVETRPCRKAAWEKTLGNEVDAQLTRPSAPDWMVKHAGDAIARPLHFHPLSRCHLSGQDWEASVFQENRRVGPHFLLSSEWFETDVSTPWDRIFFHAEKLTPSLACIC